MIFQKRVLLYDSSIKPFIDYFNKKEKLVTIDVSCGIPDVIWSRVFEFFDDFDFKPQTTNETVILYAFGKIYLHFYPAVFKKPRYCCSPSIVIVCVAKTFILQYLLTIS